jgi:hypothetical protein
MDGGRREEGGRGSAKLRAMTKKQIKELHACGFYE